MRHRLRDPTFSHFSRTPTCDRQTDRQTHDGGIYRASMALRGKKKATLRYNSTVVSPNITFHYHWGPFHLREPPSRGGGGSGVVCAGSARHHHPSLRCGTNRLIDRSKAGRESSALHAEARDSVKQCGAWDHRASLRREAPALCHGLLYRPNSIYCIGLNAHCHSVIL